MLFHIFFKHFTSMFSLAFEKFMKTKYCIQVIFWVVSIYFVTQVFFSYIFTKFFWKIYENKIFYLSNFWVISSYSESWISPSYIFSKIFWKKLENKMLYISDYMSNFHLFYYSHFPFLYIYKGLMRNLWKQNIVFK